jgi:hypothetical protein
MATTITIRNAPDTAADTTAATGRGAASRSHARSFSANRSGHSAPRATPARRSGSTRNSGEHFSVGIPAYSLDALPAAEQAELKQQARLVQNQAREQLERMTDELDLSTAQRRKIFPMLVRSTPGFDPTAMQVAGTAPPADPTASPNEEIHASLDPEQQAQIEDKEIDRQLWWQEVISRLESELVDSTGGTDVVVPPAAEPTVEEPVPADEREAPAARPGGNLLDLIE